MQGNITPNYTMPLEEEAIYYSQENVGHFPAFLLQPYSTSNIGFIVCQQGWFSFMVDEKKIQAQANETVFIPNEKRFQVVSASPDLQVSILIYEVASIRDILGTTVTSMHIYSKIYSHKLHVFHTGKEEELTHYIGLINATKRGKVNSFNAYEQRLLLLSMTYHLCSIFQNQLSTTDALNARQTEVFLHLIELIDQYFKRERGVEFYADKLCLSAKYLSGLCKSVCGYTVQELVFKAIIREVKITLDITNKTIQEISNEFNFPNASSFGTFFKKQTGTSPQKYRMMEAEIRKEPLGEATT